MFFVVQGSFELLERLLIWGTRHYNSTRLEDRGLGA